MSNGEEDADFKLAYKELKLVIRKCDKFPDRCTYTPNTHSIHFISALGLTFSVLCDSSYPTVLAFSFLEEIQKEFLQRYDIESREKATRPQILQPFLNAEEAVPYHYEIMLIIRTCCLMSLFRVRLLYQMPLPDAVHGFIHPLHPEQKKVGGTVTLTETNTFLQKIKTRYKHPRTLTTKLDLVTLSQEIRLRPPYNISPDEVNPPPLGDPFTSTSFRTSATSHKHFVPLGLFGGLTVAMTIFCSLLNLTRAIFLLNEGHIDDFDSEVYQFGALFLLCCLFFSYQLYLMCWPTSLRKPLACATLGSICLCQLYLWEHRTSVQMLFHVTVSCTATFLIFTRQIQEKLPQYNL